MDNRLVPLSPSIEVPPKFVCPSHYFLTSVYNRSKKRKAHALNIELSHELNFYRSILGAKLVS